MHSFLPLDELAFRTSMRSSLWMKWPVQVSHVTGELGSLAVLAHSALPVFFLASPAQGSRIGPANAVRVVSALRKPSPSALRPIRAYVSTVGRTKCVKRKGALQAYTAGWPTRPRFCGAAKSFERIGDGPLPP